MQISINFQIKFSDLSKTNFPHLVYLAGRMLGYIFVSVLAEECRSV